jgi:hypothetical protein
VVSGLIARAFVASSSQLREDLQRRGGQALLRRVFGQAVQVSLELAHRLAVGLIRAGRSEKAQVGQPGFVPLPHLGGAFFNRIEVLGLLGEDRERRQEEEAR